MAKLKINFDAPPPTFARAVDIPTETGKPLKVTFTFKHRDRIALAELQDAYEARAKIAAGEPADADGGEKAPEMSHVQRVELVIESDTQTIQDIATGWNIDAPFDAEHIAKLCRRYPGSALAALIDYRISCGQGRLGN